MAMRCLVLGPDDVFKNDDLNGIKEFKVDDSF